MAQSLPWSQRPGYPWLRLLVSLLLGTVGSAGMYVVAVVLPAVQAEFSVGRTGASLPYTLTMLGFGAGSIVMGALSDRLRIVAPLMIGGVVLGIGFFAASQAGSILTFGLASFVVGFGCSTTFAPLVADISLWFTVRRGIAVGIVACGNYAAGALWPQIVEHVTVTSGWRYTYILVGAISVTIVFALAWLLRPSPPGLASAGTQRNIGIAEQPSKADPGTIDPDRPLGLPANGMQALLCLSGISCCVAMSMPQVHIVALCADLGYGTVRGAQMLSLMLGCGIISRLFSGWISDHIGGPRTLLLGAVLQGIALVAFLPNQSVNMLFVASAMFGLFQGGIVPSYAMIARELFRPEQAGMRVSLTITATLLGMALGGWLSGLIYDLTLSYDWAFINGIAWNLVTVSIATFLTLRSSRPTRLALAA
ncbi:MAG: MFS transporter [Rhodospirillales bacterium]